MVDQYQLCNTQRLGVLRIDCKSVENEATSESELEAVSFVACRVFFAKANATLRLFSLRFRASRNAMRRQTVAIKS